MKPHPSPPPCYGGLLITAWPLTIVISIMVQCFITAWRVDHRKRIYMRHHHPHQHAGHAGHNAGHMPHSGAQPQPGNPHVPMRRSQSRTRETREEARQRKFRYLYQVRTARGDIISQVSSKCAPTEQQTDLSLCLDCRTSFRRCKSAFSWAARRHRRNVRSRPARTSATHSAAIAHTSPPYTIRRCATRSRLCATLDNKQAIATCNYIRKGGQALARGVGHYKDKEVGLRL